MATKNKKADLIKSIVTGVVCLSVGFWLWYSFAGNPFDEYALIKSGSQTKGFITKVTEYEEEVEEGNRERIVPKYSYEYEFKTTEGKLINGYRDRGGFIPDSLQDLEQKPYPIQVEYLSKDPNVNRVIGMHFGCTSIGEWLWRKVALGGILLIVFLSIGIIVIKKGIEFYKQ